MLTFYIQEKLSAQMGGAIPEFLLRDIQGGFFTISIPFQTKIYTLYSISDLALKSDTLFKTSKISTNDLSLARVFLLTKSSAP